VPEYGIFTKPDAERIAETVRQFQATPGVRSVLRVPQQIRHDPPGGTCSCVTVHELTVQGTATSGSFTVDIGVDDGGGIDTETKTIQYDDTAAEVQTTLETHASITSGDIDCKGGPLPGNAIQIVYLTTGNLNRYQPQPVINTNSLAGTNPVPKTATLTSFDWEA